MVERSDLDSRTYATEYLLMGVLCRAADPAVGGTEIDISVLVVLVLL